MTAPAYDVAVLGVGAVGSAALYHLARRGVSAVGLDRFPPGHDRGSSHGETRVIRKAYFEDPAYVPLLHRAYDGWREIEAGSGRRLFRRTGLIEIGPPDGEVVPGVLRAAREHDLDVEALGPEVVAQRFPGFRVPEGMTGVYEADGGVLEVEACVEAHAALARDAGAALRTGLTVTGWRPDGEGVLVETSDGPVSAGALIIAAGAWASDLLASHHLPLRVKRKVLLWYPLQPPPAPQYPIEAGGVVFLYELPEGVYYGFPSTDGATLKVACHDDGVFVDDPLTLDRALHRGDHAGVDAFLADSSPEAYARLVDRLLATPQFG
ncbi:MAG: N-methyl-L-tryptophan oxidase, partial [Myxococcota bacterium]|nr:N-methyl-L-tryptophan oxidase [Myxococcota bacterium]